MVSTYASIPTAAANAVEKLAVTFPRTALVFVRQVQRHKHLPYWQRERRATRKINSSTQMESTPTEYYVTMPIFVLLTQCLH